MPRVTVSVQLANGQIVVLTEGDKLVKEVTIECCSQRCASRHGQELPQEVSLIDGQPMPPEGRQWLSLILPETSPQYTPMPPNFCSPSCVRDFLSYQYIAPSSAGVNLPPNEYDTPVQKTDIDAEVARIGEDMSSGFAESMEQAAALTANEPLAQADGVGE